MRLKKGVKTMGVSNEILLGIMVVDTVYKRERVNGATITSITDGKHSATSRHYIGMAFDVRTRDDYNTVQWSSGHKERVAKSIRESLTEEYVVVVEATHIHVQYNGARQ